MNVTQFRLYLLEGIFLLSTLGILVLVLPRWLQSREHQRNLACRSNLYNLNMVMMLYLQDHNFTYPLRPRSSSSATPYGWADMMLVYGSNPAWLRCPDDPAPLSHDPRQSGYTSYWINSNLYGKRMDDVEDRHPLLFGEGSDGHDITNARYAKSSLPPWVKRKSGPAVRHLNAFADLGSGANYVWVSTLWQTPDDVMRSTGPDLSMHPVQPPQ